jgi:hypothetical protein
MQMSNFSAQKKAFLGLALIIFVALPVLSFGKSGVIYVDEDAKGTQDGSQDHPYKSISKALDKAKKGTEVRVKGGTYETNITIPSGVKLTSASNNRDKVTIKAKHNDRPTVTMKQGSKISAVTIRDGRHGIRVENDAKAHIYNVTIKNSKRDGIHADPARVDESKRVLIDKVYITGSAMSGVYAEKRLITILDSDIDGNAWDGVDIKAGSKAWIEDTRVRWNGGSGLRATIDGSSIWTKGSSFRNNRLAGVEAISFGGGGSLGIKKGTIVGNATYGIAKVQKQGTFQGLQVGSGVNDIHFDNNGKGNISPLLPNF